MICIEGYLCLLQGSVLIIDVICCICLLVFFIGSQAISTFLLRLPEYLTWASQLIMDALQ
jgi:hypothetical protein